MPDPGSNEIFQSAVRNAALFKSVVTVSGLACIYMGYRLLGSARRRERAAVQAGDSSLSPRAVERLAPGLVLLAFGMIIIFATLFRSTPILLREGERVEGNDSGGTSQVLLPGTSGIAPRDSRSGEQNVSTKVRDGGGSTVGFTGENEVRREPQDAFRVRRGAGGVQTKGAYTPIQKSKATETNQFRIPE